MDCKILHPMGTAPCDKNPPWIPGSSRLHTMPVVFSGAYHNTNTGLQQNCRLRGRAELEGLRLEKAHAAEPESLFFVPDAGPNINLNIDQGCTRLLTM